MTPYYNDDNIKTDLEERTLPFPFDTVVRYAIDNDSRFLLNSDNPTYLPTYTTSYLRRHELITVPSKITLTVGIATTLRSGRLRDRCSIPVMVNFISSSTLPASQTLLFVQELSWPELVFRQSPLPRPSIYLLTHSLYLVTCLFLQLT